MEENENISDFLSRIKDLKDKLGDICNRPQKTVKIKIKIMHSSLDGFVIKSKRVLVDVN